MGFDPKNDETLETTHLSRERWNSRSASRAFAFLLQNLSADDFAELLSNWNESEWDADAKTIMRFPGRDQRFSRGAEGGKITVPKRDLLVWLDSNQPLDPATYSMSKSWMELISRARSAVAPQPGTDEPNSEQPADAPAPAAG